MLKVYVLLLHLCCSPIDEEVRIDNLSSPERAAVLLWQANQDGHCFEGRCLEYDFSNPGDMRIRQVALPTLSFSK